MKSLALPPSIIWPERLILSAANVTRPVISSVLLPSHTATFPRVPPHARHNPSGAGFELPLPQCSSLPERGPLFWMQMEAAFHPSLSDW